MPHVDYKIVHSIAGRLRLCVPRLKSDSVFAESLAWYLSHQKGVDRVRLSRDCSALVVEFEPQTFEPLACLDGLSEDILTNQEMPLDDSSLARLSRSATYRLVMQVESIVSPLAQVALGGLALGAVVFSWPAWLTRIVLLASVIPVANRAARTALEERRLGADAMDGMACLLLVGRGNFLPVGIMTCLISIGEFIRELAIRRCQYILDYLQGLEHESAWLISGDSRISVPAHELKPGDVAVVYAGECVPVSGIIIDGVGKVAAVEGPNDWLTRDSEAGQAVFRGNLVLSGKLYVRAVETISKPLMSTMEARLRRRALYRTNFQQQAVAKGYRVVGPVLFLCAIFYLFQRNPANALALLCFDFLTAIRVAVPTAILSCLYRIGQRGVLIRSAAALEKLSQVDVVVFARTGVLTSGDAVVVEVICLDERTDQELVRLAAAAVSRYHHPAARAIYGYAQTSGITVPNRTSAMVEDGFGVTATVERDRVSVGSKCFMEKSLVDTSMAESQEFYVAARGDSLSYVSINGRLSGLVAYRDPLRPETACVIDGLLDLGIEDIVVTSGEAAEVLRLSTEKLNVSGIFSELTGQDKAALVRDFQRRGKQVAVVGDDVSDAAALAQADLAISLRESTYLARSRSDIVLSGGGLTGLVDGIHMARAGLALARSNLFFVSLPNWTGLFLSLGGFIGPVGGTLINNGSVIFGALNGLTPLKLTNHEDACSNHAG